MILLVLRVPAVRLAFGAKGFPWQATLLTGQVVALFAISVFAQSAIQILVRGFYALSNTKTPLFLGAIAVLTNVALSFWFVYSLNLSVLGLALAISLSSFLHAGLLFIFLHRQVQGFDLKQLFTPFIKMSLATVVTGVSLWAPLRLLDLYVLNTARTIDLIILTVITIAVGLSVYLLLSKLLKVKELDSFLSLVKRIKNFKQVLSQTEEVLEPSAPPA